MKLIKNIIVAFSLYSQIPMPRFEWKEEDMKHNIAFLPWIGAVIGLVSLGLYYLFSLVELPLICKVALYSAVPLLITGGFHIDGYMDVQDALKSYKTSEEKLEILKDPHIGAFAVIRLLIFSLIWAAGLSIVANSPNEKLSWAYFIIFFMARAGSIITSLKFKHARKNGMLNMETDKSGRLDFDLGVIQLVIAIWGLSWINLFLALALAGAFFVHLLYYRKLCYSQFGGVTGDTAGFYVTTLEEWLLVVVAVMSFLI